MQNIAIECHNEDEWKSCLAKNGGTLSSDFSLYRGKGKTGSHCMNLDGKSHCPLDWYINNGYTILQAVDYIIDKPSINNHYSII